MRTSEVIAALSAVTVTTTSAAIEIGFQDQTLLQFICAGHASGNGVFTIDGSNDKTNWVTGVAFLDAVGTASTTLVTSKTLGANGSAGAVIVNKGFRYIRVVCTVTTDGSYTALVSGGG